MPAMTLTPLGPGGWVGVCVLYSFFLSGCLRACACMCVCGWVFVEGLGRSGGQLGRQEAWQESVFPTAAAIYLRLRPPGRSDTGGEARDRRDFEARREWKRRRRRSEKDSEEGGEVYSCGVEFQCSCEEKTNNTCRQKHGVV